jgi:hypothetical protein
MVVRVSYFVYSDGEEDRPLIINRHLGCEVAVYNNRALVVACTGT